MNQMITTFLDVDLLNKIIADCRGWRAVVVLDIDGTILNPVQIWRNWINTQTRMTVTADDIEKAGNVSNYFKEINRYEEVKDKIDQLIK
ncbi:MAG: hypothetical protein Q8L64_02795, partial [bacterium]|nr:hypothetical protein [bacterium]